ncbi:MAG: hypothetical protein WCX97_04370 [Candidatus Magasanikbacteria bacterium]
MPTLPNGQQSENWRLALRFISQCPICGTKYEESEARLTGKKEHANLVHITCLKCHSYFVAMVMEVGAGVSSIGTVTDLSSDDVKRVSDMAPITLDEVLDAHDSIQSLFLTK